MFAVVKNNDIIELESATVINSTKESFFARLFASPKTALTYAYAVFSILITIALALDTFIEIRRRHPMHIMYALLLWILIIALLYIGGIYLFPDVVIL